MGDVKIEKTYKSTAILVVSVNFSSIGILLTVSEEENRSLFKDPLVAKSIPVGEYDWKAHGGPLRGEGHVDSDLPCPNRDRDSVRSDRPGVLRPVGSLHLESKVIHRGRQDSLPLHSPHQRLQARVKSTGTSDPPMGGRGPYHGGVGYSPRVKLAKRAVGRPLEAPAPGR